MPPTGSGEPQGYNFEPPDAGHGCGVESAVCTMWIEKRKVLANYTEVNEIDTDGSSKFYCFFLNHYGLRHQLAMLLLQLKGLSYWPSLRIDGTMVDPLKEAMKEVVITDRGPAPRGFIEYNGKVYFGHVRELVEIEIPIKHEDDRS